jgi:hypothetical protein
VDGSSSAARPRPRAGLHVDALLDDRSADNPLGTVVAAAQRHGILVAGFAGTAGERTTLRAHGIQCLGGDHGRRRRREGLRTLLAADGDR